MTSSRSAVRASTPVGWRALVLAAVAVAAAGERAHECTINTSVRESMGELAKNVAGCLIEHAAPTCVAFNSVKSQSFIVALAC